MYADWIKRGIHKPGKSAVGLAQAITKALKLKTPMHRVTVHKMVSGKRSVYSEELLPISIYIEEPIPNLNTNSLGVVSIPIVGECCAGTWTEGEALISGSTISAPRDIEFENAELTAYDMRGSSMVLAGIIDGDVLICIPPEDDEIKDGKQVVIRRTRTGLVELSARVVHIVDDRTEYHTACIDNRYKPVVVQRNNKDEKIEVVAIVRRVIRNIP